MASKETKWLVRRYRRLNIGMLNPDRAEAFRSIDNVARAAETVKVFLVLPDEFLSVLEREYGITDADILSRKPEEVDPVLMLFLQKGGS